MDDGIPERLYFLREVEYNKRHEQNSKSKNSQANPTLKKSTWHEMRKMWENREIAQASSKNKSKKIHSSLRSLPRESAQDTWFRELGETKKEEELCDMWKNFYTSSFKKAQNMFPEMFKRIGQIERSKKVGTKNYQLTKAQHRIQRLKALGNSIVPQVAKQIFRAISKS